MRLGILATCLLALGSVFVSTSVLARADEGEDADKTLEAAEADGATPYDGKNPWNEWDGDFATMRFGFGYLTDTANYSQDEDSKKQMNLKPLTQLRDFRLLAKGRFKQAPRLSYTIGYMYDAGIQDWRFRQTGLMFDIPEWNGHFFVGRTKEGFSTSKIMVGYYGWTNERAAANDAFLPILADGVKWMGSTTDGKLLYTLGWFGRINDQSYQKNGMILTGRAVWLPYVGTDSVLHLCAEYRYGTDLHGTLQYRSKPESYPAQSYAVDTGKFAAKSSDTAGLELYYRPKPSGFMVGSEYFFNWVSSEQTQNPLFHGGEAFVAYLFNGVRGYNEKGGFFTAVRPERPVFTGGPGAWELVLRSSYVDLDSGTIEGGKFWRITPMANWHMSENVRVELVMGYSRLQRFGVNGETKYFQTRLQFTL